MTGLTVLDCWKANRVPTFAIGNRRPNLSRQREIEKATSCVARSPQEPNRNSSYRTVPRQSSGRRCGHSSAHEADGKNERRPVGIDRDESQPSLAFPPRG